MTDINDAKRIADTWEEIGLRARPLRKMVFVRTELIPEMVGLIYIPPNQRGNYSQLPHVVMMRALVLSTGPDCKVLKVGDRVAFMRLFFARWHHMEDKTLTGYLDEDNIWAYDLTDPDEKILPARAIPLTRQDSTEA